MRFLWVLLAAAAVAAPVVLAETSKVETVGADVADWRERAIELLQKAIGRLEGAISQLPEDSRMRPILEKALDYLRRKLTDLQDGSVAFSEVNRAGILQKILDRLEEALEKLPEGPLRDRLQESIDKIRDLLNSIRPEDSVVVSDKIREILNRIRELIDENKEAGKEALLKFLNSDLLESLVSRLPEPIQSEVRARIDSLKDRLENNTVSVGDWRERAIELLQKAIGYLERAISMLPEDSKLRPLANKALDYLRKKLTDLQDAAMSFSEADRSGILQDILSRLEGALEKLPEGPLRDRLQEYINKIRELLSSIRPEEGIVVSDRIREILDRIRELIDENKEAGKEALLKFLNSDLLEGLVSRLPDPIQSEVRARIEALKDRLLN